MSMDQQQTFNWLTERDRKLTQIERALSRNSELRALLAFEIARETVAPIVAREKLAEDQTKGFRESTI